MSSAGTRVRRPDRRRRLRVALWTLAAVLVVVVGLGVWIGTGLRDAPGAAYGARDALVAVKSSLATGDVAAAEEQVASARRHVDALQSDVQGARADVARVVPIVGGAVADVRHLADALDALTAAAEIGVRTWPRLDSVEEPLMSGQRVDLVGLTSVVDEFADAETLMSSAIEGLEQVADSRLVVGSRLALARDEALAEVEPLASTADTALGVAEQMPRMLGSEGSETYLIAVLNPSEQRYSGGAPLTLATMTASNGRIRLGEVVDTTVEDAFKRMRWPRVPGNVFHRGGLYITGANMAPSWTVSGDEVARAWAKKTGTDVAGVIAIDPIALADLLRVTGSATRDGTTFDSTTLVHETIGNYDAYEDDLEGRKALNHWLVDVFTERFFGSGSMVEKGQSFIDSAGRRNAALWFADADVQAAVQDAGLSGDLSDTTYDYLGVFNQNTGSNKSDYWQRRSIDSRVQLAADGSAEVRLRIRVHNDSEQWVQPYEDPRHNSFVTRWNDMSLAAFLPAGVEEVEARVDGKVLPDVHVGRFYERPFTRTNLRFAPQQTHTYELRYTVPHAAQVAEDGTLTYRLDVDPQGLVTPQELRVELTAPDGYTFGQFPDDWSQETGVLTWDVPALTHSTSVSVSATP